ncbi:MAG: glycosyltransferase family 2 protein [Alphaproteobacteria bacterium]|nr:glycosyltransferase family 2 protein [Alphaproteobacteria bacterium]
MSGFRLDGIAVVIPCYRVGRAVLDVIARIGPEVARIYCVDDACPDRTADLVEREAKDPRVVVIRHAANGGVGAAVVTGYKAAMADGMRVIVKVDGDGQMDPALLPAFVGPILRGEADYTKGNRFYDPDGLKGMPPVRLVGNAALSLLTKASSGYWTVFDPTNGYTAVHAAVLDLVPLDRLARRYFFESDMLFRLNLARAVVLDVPMKAVYGSERSNLDPLRVAPEFLRRNLANLAKRIVYGYLLRDFNAASLALLAGLPLTLFGLVYGALTWAASAAANALTPAGKVMIAALPIIVGAQLLLTFFGFDMAAVPQRPIHPRLVEMKAALKRG